MTFSQLPYDVQLSILSYARPLDVLAVRKTCRILAQASRERSLWIQALERMCLENALFKPSFDTERMSVQELEYACLGPERWERLMIKTASAITALPEKAKIAFRAPPGLVFEKMYLVPGGRYMLALVGEVQHYGQTRLTLWDLSDISHPVQAPIASIEVDPYFLSFTAHQSKDGNKLRVLTRKRMWPRQKYTVLEVAPGEEFQVLGTLWTDEAGFTSIYQDMLVLARGPIVTVWNFMEDKGVIWEVQRPTRSSQMMVENGTVTLIAPRAAYVFKIPPLRLSAAELAQKEGNHTILEPSAVLRFLSPHPTHPNTLQVQQCNAICDWYTGNPQPILFDFPDVDDEHQHYRFQLVFPSSNNTLDGVRVSQLCSYLIPDTHGDNAHAPYRLCGDNVVLWWTTLDQVRCTVGRKDASHADLIASNILLTGGVPHLGSKEYSLCPVSGRFMWIDATDSGTCYIKDFEPGVEHQQEVLADPVQDPERTGTEDTAVFIEDERQHE